MSLFGKGLVALLLALPVGAYAAGSLADAQSDLPDERTPITVPDPAREPARAGRPRDREPAADTRADREEARNDRDDDDDDVEVVRPEPEDLDAEETTDERERDTRERETDDD